MKKIILLLLTCLIALPASAAEVAVTWTPPTRNCDSSPLTDLAGHTVWYGSSPRPALLAMPLAAPAGTGGCNYSGYIVWRYPNSVAVTGTSATIVLPNVEFERTLYFSVTARDGAGNESAYAEEKMTKIPPTMLTPMAPTNVGVVVR